MKRESGEFSNQGQVIKLSEDFQIEDEAEKLAEGPDEVITRYLSEHGAAGREKLIETLRGFNKYCMNRSENN